MGDFTEIASTAAAVLVRSGSGQQLMAKPGQGRPWNSEYRVYWQPDSSATACSVCENDFTWRYRRHHCRFCGDVVCNDCSDRKAPHPTNDKNERIFNSCLAKCGANSLRDPSPVKL